MDKNDILYEKMRIEQKNFEEHLMEMTPKELLAHAYEYITRENIVMVMEELELTNMQAEALLGSESPVAEIYRYLEKVETNYMDVIRESILNCAEDACSQEGFRTVPLYLYSPEYAFENGEMDVCKMSYRANILCKESIESAISSNYSDCRLDTEAAIQRVLDQHSIERVRYVLANTIRHLELDDRISKENKNWAKCIPMVEDNSFSAIRDQNNMVMEQVHPGLLNLFIEKMRKMF